MRDEAPLAVAAISPRLFRAVALIILAVNALVLLVLMGIQLIAPGPAVVALMVGEALAVGATLATLAMLPRRPFTVAAMPLIVATMLLLGTYGLVFQPMTGVATVAVLLAVLLAALTGSRRLTAMAAVMAALLSLLIMPLAAALGLAFDAGPLMGQLLFVGPVTIIGLGWLAVDRLIQARDAAVALAERRAEEAEAARALAEQARAEAVARAEEQARLLELVQSLELPVLAVGPGVLAVPLIGALDDRRLEAIRAAALEAVGRERAHTVVFDLTGIADIDTAVAHGLLAAAQAVRLLGATPLLSGVRAPVAQALAGLGVPLDGLRAVGNLQEALAMGGRP